MNTKKITRIRYFEWIIWLLLMVCLVSLFYNLLILKNILNEIAFSILAVVFMISIIIVRKTKARLQRSFGLLKSYGKRNIFNVVFLTNIILGLFFILLGFLDPSNKHELVFKITLGLCWILAGIANGTRYYIQITDKYIIKSNLKWLNVKDIENINFLSNKIELKTSSKTLDIHYSEIKNNEKQLIINDFEKIKLKINLA